MRVEQVRSRVQCDPVLPVPGRLHQSTPLNGARMRGLLGLDRGDDVAHWPARRGEAGEQRPFADQVELSR